MCAIPPRTGVRWWAAAAVLLLAAAAYPSWAEPPSGEAAPADPGDRARAFVLEAQAHPETLDVPAARAALAALDADGEVDSVEGRWLLDRLLEAEPDDTELLWLRARLRSAVGDVPGTIHDLETLVAASPPAALRATALRWLARSYAEEGRYREEVRIERILLDEQLEEPVPVLIRLAKAHRRLGNLKATREVLDRLLHIAPDELRFNPDLVWIAAETSRRVDEPLRAGRRFLDFANLFPDDPRSVEALVEAARLMQNAGRLQGARMIAGEAIARGGDGHMAAAARLLRAEIEERLGRRREARADYHYVVTHTLDPSLAADALRELVELSLSDDGLRPTLLMLAGMTIRGDGYSKTFGASHFARLMRAGHEKLVRTDRDAAFYMTLAFEMGAPELLPAEVRIRAARFFGSLGDREKVQRILAPLAATLGEQGRKARALMAEHGLKTPLGEAKAKLDERATLLWRARDWKALAELLDDTTLATAGTPRLRALRADAELRLGRPAEARRVLDRAPRSGSGKILFADAASLRGDWKAACAAYRAAAADDLPAVERAWCEVRVAACEHREGQPDRARKRIARLMNAPEPIGPACAATVLGLQWGLEPATEARR